MKLFFCWPLLLLPAAALAQATGLSNDQQRDGVLTSRFGLGYVLAPAEPAGVQGSPLLVPGWLPGRLQLSGGTKVYEVPLKYDVYRQELRARRPPGDSVVVELARVQEFSLAARRFACYPAAGLPADVKGGCGEVLYDGPRAQLLKYQRKELVQQRTEAGGYAETTTVPVLEAQTAYYLRWPADGHFTALRPRRASLEQALAGQPAALAALKARKGGIGSEAELATAVAAVAPLLTGAGK